MLERTNPKPLYLQFEEIIRDRIESHEWKPNSPIPSENELSRTYGLSRMTVRSVITQFVKEGLLYRVPGKGTYVVEPKITTKSLSYAGIREQLERMGYEIFTKVLSVQVIPATEKIAEKLNVNKEDPVYALERIRYIKNEPLSVHTSYMPEDLCRGLETKGLEDEQLCVILRKDFNLSRGKVVETLESSRATSPEARLLNVKPGYPLLLLEDIIYSESGKPFEYSKVLFRGDKIILKFEFDQL